MIGDLIREGNIMIVLTFLICFVLLWVGEYQLWLAFFAVLLVSMIAWGFRGWWFTHKKKPELYYDSTSIAMDEFIERGLEKINNPTEMAWALNILVKAIPDTFSFDDKPVLKEKVLKMFDKSWQYYGRD